MPEKENLWRKLGKELRPHAIWEVIRWIVITAGSLMIPIIVALWQKIRHVPLDWAILGGLFLVSFAIFSVGIGVLLYIGRKIGAAAETNSSVPQTSEEPLVGTPELAQPLPVAIPGNKKLISLTPQELVRLFNTGGTSAQANRLIQPYVGKWMQISGVVNDVAHFGPDTNQVSFTEGPMGLGIIILMYFREKWADEVSMLVKGENITVRGQLRSIEYRDTVALNKCELLAKRRS
jgi:hypothetical protein